MTRENHYLQKREKAKLVEQINVEDARLRCLALNEITVAKGIERNSGIRVQPIPMEQRNALVAAFGEKMSRCKLGQPEPGLLERISGIDTRERCPEYSIPNIQVDQNIAKKQRTFDYWEFPGFHYGLIGKAYAVALRTEGAIIQQESGFAVAKLTESDARYRLNLAMRGFEEGPQVFNVHVTWTIDDTKTGSQVAQNESLMVYFRRSERTSAEREGWRTCTKQATALVGDNNAPLLELMEIIDRRK